MTDIALDTSVLLATSADITAVAHAVSETVDTGPPDGAAFGSPAVASALAAVSGEHAARAGVASEGLASAGARPAAAATGFTTLDRRMVSAQ